MTLPHNTLQPSPLDLERDWAFREAERFVGLMERVSHDDAVLYLAARLRATEADGAVRGGDSINQIIQGARRA